MEDYIKIPEWIEDIEKIFSSNFISSGMKEFVHESKVKIDFLREVYTANRELFIDIIDEMSIRGFEFFPVKESNLFPKKIYEQCRYIISDNRSDINKLDFEKYDMGTFMSRFSVYVENFFDFIPVEGFLYLNPNMNIKEFELMFKLAGFSIIEYTQISSKNTEETQVKLDDPMIYLDGKYFKKTELESIFHGGTFNNLQKFFRTENIKNLDQIDIDVINRYARFGGTGKLKIEALQKKLIHIVHSNELKSLKKMDLYGLKYWFLGNFSIPFIEKCHSENIFSIIDVSEDIIREYSPIFGYSKGQLKELMDTLKMAKESLEQILHEGEKTSFQNINSVTKHKCIRLDSIIPSNSFKVVHNYFNEANIIYLDNITNEIFISIVNLKGFGKNRVERIRGILINEYLLRRDHMELQYDVRTISFWFPEDEWTDLRNFCSKMNVVDIRDINENLISKYCLEYKMTKAAKSKVLNILKESESIWVLDKIEYSELDERQIIKTPHEIIRRILELNKDTRTVEILKRRYLEEETFEQIGNDMEITRERVRQISAKGIRQIKQILDAENFIESLKKYYIDENVISTARLYEDNVEGNEYIVRLIEHEYSEMNIYSPLDLIIINGKASAANELEEYILNLPEIFKLYDHIDYFVEKISDLGIIDPEIYEIEQIAGYYGYKMNGEYFTKLKLTIGTVLQIIFRDFIFEPLKLKEEGLDKLRELARNIFEFELPENLRALDSRIRDLPDVILVDSSTFIDIRNFEYDYRCIEFLDEILSKKFITDDVVSSDYLMENNREILEGYGIMNKFAVYSMIKYHLGDKYRSGGGNTLEIYKAQNTQNFSREERVLQLLNANEGIMDKEQLLKDLGWTVSRLDQAVGFSQKVVYAKGKVIEISSLKFDMETIQRCEVILKNSLGDQGFTSSFKIFKDLRFDEIGSRFLIDNNITDPNELAPIFKKLFSYLRGHLMFISSQDSKYSTIEEVIRERYCDGFERFEIRDFMEEMGYSSLMTSTIMERILLDGSYVQIDIDKYVESSRIIISENDIKILKEYIENQFEDKEYISLANLSGYRKKLPKIEGFKWNPYLIKSILERNGYRYLSKHNNDYRYDKQIMVRDDSKIMTCEDLFVDIIKKEYRGNMHETCIYDYFAELGLLNSQDHIRDKKLPHGLKFLGRIYVDEYRRVSLTEEGE